jgi:hypothetical protein
VPTVTARPAGCQARREGDGGVRCIACGLAWDHDDQDPPACGPRKPSAWPFKESTEPPILEFAQSEPTPQTLELPIDLPADLAARMGRAFMVAYGSSGDHGAAMRAAWRVALDEFSV